MPGFAGSLLEKGRLSGSAHRRRAPGGAGLSCASEGGALAQDDARARRETVNASCNDPNRISVLLLSTRAQSTVNTKTAPPSGVAASIFVPTSPRNAARDTVRPTTTATYCLPFTE